MDTMKDITKRLKNGYLVVKNKIQTPLDYNYIHGIGLLAGEAEIKEDENGVSAVCCIYDTPYGRRIKELIDNNLQFELGAYINMVETTTHGDEIIVTKGVIREISIVPVENVRYPVKIEKSDKD